MIIELDTRDVAPIQENLYAPTLGEITRSYFKDAKKMIVPLRDHPFYDGKFSLLDGHHSSCIAETLNEFSSDIVKLYGWLADNEDDLIDPDKLSNEFYKEEIYWNNANIMDNFAKTPKYLEDIGVSESIKELRLKYSQLESITSLLDYSYKGLDFPKIKNLSKI